MNLFTLKINELSLPVDPVLVELSLKPLPVLEHDGPMPFLKIIFQRPFIIYPLLLQIIKVSIVE